MAKFNMTREEHAQAVLKAIDEVHQKNMQSKEAALDFLRRAGIILEDNPEPEAKSKTKKSK